MDKKVKNQLRLFFLLFNNLIPIIGLLFYNWQFINIIFVYWCETLILGFFKLPKLYRDELRTKIGVQDIAVSFLVRLKVITSLFIVSSVFIIFPMIFYFLFLIMAFNQNSGSMYLLDDMSVLWSSTKYAVLVILLSNLLDHVLSRFHLQASGRQAAKNNYVAARVLILHFVTIIGTFLFYTLHQALAPLLVLVLLKIAADLSSYHKRKGIY